MTTTLREVVDAALDVSSRIDPATVAAEVVAALPARALRGALAESLPAYVTAMIIARRALSIRESLAGEVANDSPRWRAASDLLRNPFHNGSEWKALGDCTADDLELGADGRRRRAESILAEADRWERLAKEVRNRNVSTVADLGIARVLEVLA